MLHSHSLPLRHPWHLSSHGNTGNLSPYSVKTKNPIIRVVKLWRQSVFAGAARPLSRPAVPGPSRTHTMPPEKVEIFKSLNEWAKETVLPLLKPVEKCWHPHDFLPDSSSPLDVFEEQVRELRKRASNLPNDCLVVLIGDMITEDALPTYLSFVNRHDGVNDKTGVSPDAWATWNRGWTAEENRHGDMIKTYLYLSGRVNLHMIDRTIQYLIAGGMDPGTENNPYLGYVYLSLQERATFTAHGNTARLAKEHGDIVLARICGSIAGDEKRHENAYTKMVEKLLEVDPSTTMLAISDMMLKKIAMPGYLMYDGNDPNLFDHFSAVAEKTGIYTFGDYADIMDFFVGRWKLEKIEGLNSDAQEAQDFVCGLAPRFRKVNQRAAERARKEKPLPRTARFGWIFDKEVAI